MARQRLGTDGKCSLMAQWWATVPAGQRPFYEERAKEFPYMRPCPKSNGWWTRKDEYCDYCEHAIFAAETSTKDSTIGRGNEE